jgi:hypothetical protein
MTTQAERAIIAPGIKGDQGENFAFRKAKRGKALENWNQKLRNLSPCNESALYLSEEMKSAAVGVLALSALADLSGVQAFVPGSVGLGAATSLQMSSRHEHSSSSAALTRRGAITLGSFAALGLGLAAPAEAKRKGDVKGLFEDDGTETKEEKIERKRKVGAPHEKETSCQSRRLTDSSTVAICPRLVWFLLTFSSMRHRKGRSIVSNARPQRLRWRPRLRSCGLARMWGETCSCIASLLRKHLTPFLFMTRETSVGWLVTGCGTDLLAQIKEAEMGTNLRGDYYYPTSRKRHALPPNPSLSHFPLLPCSPCIYVACVHQWWFADKASCRYLPRVKRAYDTIEEALASGKLDKQSLDLEKIDAALWVWRLCVPRV